MRRYIYRLDVHVRRSADTKPLADHLASLLRDLLGDADLSVVAAPGKRGGRITIDTEVDLTGGMEPALALQQKIDTTPNLIERIDWYRVGVFAGDGIVGFTQGDYRGWIREVALEELQQPEGQKGR